MAGLWSEPCGGRRDALGTAPTKRVFPNLPRFCSSITIWGCNISFWYVTVCHLPFLRLRTWAYLTHLFPNIPGSEPYLSGILPYQSPIFTHVTIILSDVAALQPSIAFIQSYLSKVFTYESVV